MATYSRDQQPAEMVVSVNYRINPDAVARIYESYGSEAGLVARIINPRTNQESKVVFGRFNAVAAIQERARLNIETEEAIRTSINREDNDVIVDAVQIESIDFSDAYEQSIEQRMLAEVEVQRIQQNLERERVQAEIVETQARAEAFRVQAMGEAEASAIRARGEALRDNPALIDLVQAERWDGKLPTQMIPNNALPILGLN